MEVVPMVGLRQRCHAVVVLVVLGNMAFLLSVPLLPRRRGMGVVIEIAFVVLHFIVSHRHGLLALQRCGMLTLIVGLIGNMVVWMDDVRLEGD